MRVIIALSRCITPVVLLLIVCGLAACGSNSSTRPPAPSPTSETVVSTTQPSVQSTPSGVKVTPTETKALILVQTNKNSYTSSEVVSITITNRLNRPIYISNLYTNCTPVLLERASAKDQWSSLGRCPTGQGTFTQIKPGEVIEQKLTPGVSGGVSKPHINTQWQTGTYRISLHYAFAPDQDELPATSVQSLPFSIS